MSRLIRCIRQTPQRHSCDCPVRWDERRGFVHAPELAGNDEQRALHAAHITQCLHMAAPPDEVREFVAEARQGRPADLKLALEGRWIKRRRT